MPELAEKLHLLVSAAGDSVSTSDCPMSKQSRCELFWASNRIDDGTLSPNDR
jgi:hypothetical protein